jgi:D-alanyl-D-alanine carboxypeptidase (penicillin-binding protein 5/6)
MRRNITGMNIVKRNTAAALAVLILAVVMPAGSVYGQGIETPAKQAYLIDDTTGAVLLAKNAYQQMTPSSMSKLMTMYLVFERLAVGSLKLDDEFKVSVKAWRMGGSKMFVREGTSVAVHDLLRGVIVQSGNDACIVLAEGLAGSEDAFVAEMNRKAQEIGLTHSHFANATGWPAEGHHMSPQDLAKLAKLIIHKFPQYYEIFSEKNFKYNKIQQGNRNPLLYKNIGADGLKTGHTEIAGYGLTASAVQGDRRLILVVNGLKSVSQRARESERLMKWGFREFNNYAMFKAGQKVEDAEVWLGQSSTVPLVTDKDITVTLPRKHRADMKVAVVYDGPIPAPITQGAQIAKLVITTPDRPDTEIPLYAGESVEQLGVMGRLFAALGHLIWGATQH